MLGEHRLPTMVKIFPYSIIAEKTKYLGLLMPTPHTASITVIWSQNVRNFVPMNSSVRKGKTEV